MDKHLKVTKTEINHLFSDNIIKAVATITINDILEISGISVIEGNMGLEIQYPSNPWANIGNSPAKAVHSLSIGLFEDITNSVLTAYQKAMGKI